MSKLRFRRGLLATMPSLLEGEPGFTKDTDDLYIGIGDGTSVLMAKQKTVDSIRGINEYETVATYTNGRLTSVQEKDGSVVVNSASLTYDADGVLVSVLETIGGVPITSTLHYTNGVLTSVSKQM